MTRQQGLTFGFIAGLAVLAYFAFKSPATTHKQDFSSEQEQMAAALPSPENKPVRPSMAMQVRAPQRNAASDESADSEGMEARHHFQTSHHALSPLNRDISVGELRDSDVLDSSWKLITSVVATPSTQVSEEDRSMAVGQSNGYTFFDAGRAGVDENLFSTERPLLVYNPRLQTVGVMTGIIMISLRSGTSVEAVAEDLGLRVRDSFPETNTYFVTSQTQPFSLSQLKARLESDARVNKVETEIVSHQYGKR